MISQLLMQFQICLLLTVILLPALKVEARAWSYAPIALHGCNDTCGNVSIPFPFGIGGGCFLHDWYKVDCKASPNLNGSTKPFLSKFGVEVLEITFESHNNSISTQKVIVSLPPLNVCTEETQPQQLRVSGMDFRGSPYNFSMLDNVLVMEGCPGGAFLLNQSNNIVTGCATICDNITTAVSTKSCYGSKCCQTVLTSDSNSSNSLLQSYHIDFSLKSSGESQNCFVTTLLKNGVVNEFVGKLSNSEPSFTAPVVLTWKWMSNLPPPENISEASCSYLAEANGLYCSCHKFHFGNPYYTGGCIAICAHSQCQGRIIAHISIPSLVILVLGLIVVVIGLYVSYRFNKKRMELKRRAKFFKRNGGLLLKQQLSSNDGVVEKTRIFTITELDKATDQFNENRILGQGGQGTVYKGMLIDGRIVAIKKSKLLDENQSQQFINEVVILSQINHRNVVKLLGCCLEVEVPLLVYEFILNGTLSQQIHDPEDDFILNWGMRLKIAADAANAITYLHSSSSIPIYHRDIKSSNILLDDRYRAKVSDFGISRTTSIHQTYFVTDVRGTFGYVDPEYFQTLRFTRKSDVYSFGVVLLELLTSKKAVYGEDPEVKSLTTEFLHLMESSRLSEILDPEIAKEAKEGELEAVIELARRCLSWNGKLRPSMKQTAMALEMIMKSPAQVSTWYQQAFPTPDLGDDEMAETEISEVEFMSNPLPAGASSSYIDVHPLLPTTV